MSFERTKQTDYIMAKNLYFQIKEMADKAGIKDYKEPVPGDAKKVTPISKKEKIINPKTGYGPEASAPEKL